MKKLITTIALAFIVSVGVGQSWPKRGFIADSATSIGKFTTNKGFFSTTITDGIKPGKFVMLGLNVWFMNNQRNIMPVKVDTVYIHVKPNQTKWLNDSTLIITNPQPSPRVK